MQTIQWRRLGSAIGAALLVLAAAGPARAATEHDHSHEAAAPHKRVVLAVNQYGKHFEHPGFKAIHTGH